MRPAVLSISTERVLAPIRNTVLAHAGYDVIPATSTHSALHILSRRHVCGMIIASSVPLQELRALCSEGHRRHVPMVVLDPYGHLAENEAESQSELHINPLDGPEAFLKALAILMQRDHPACSF